MKPLALSPTKTELEYLSNAIPEYASPVDCSLQEWYESADPDCYNGLLYLVKYLGAPGALGTFEIDDTYAADSGKERSDLFRTIADNARRISVEPLYREFQFLIGRETGFDGCDEVLIFFPYKTPVETVREVMNKAYDAIYDPEYKPIYLPLRCPDCPDRNKVPDTGLCLHADRRCLFEKSYVDHRGYIFQVEGSDQSGWHTVLWDSTGGESAYNARAALLYIPTRPCYSDAQSELNRFAQVMGLREHY